MNKLSFKILPSEETNDHEARILIDGQDYLGKDYLGVDPVSFFAQTLEKNGEILVGRCTCGVEGCCDLSLTVSDINNTILWTNNDGLNLSFDKSEYVASIHQARNDHSWEDLKRKVERLVTNILRDSQTKDNYKFDWASARIKDNQITLSYIKNDDQKLFYISWDGITEDNVVIKAQKFHEERLSSG
ncbi:MAG: hypothetical protein BGO70_09725 [Bacteroidetes bacterium 43-93]|nr:hypothetical protein [Bacteroidota bacterium]OJX00437.1 MAG: hypothetical protein BGO70_09725 [Bacteroidetes bacterium 43-93]